MEASANVLKSDRITFVIFTYNEERRIHWSIQNFKPWGRVLVVDNHSEDKTVEIARSLGCEVLLSKNEGWVEEEKSVLRVKAAVQTEWIYWAFADEIADARTLQAILDAVHSEKYSIVNIARKNYYYGRFCYDAFADRMNRIFKKDAIDFTANTIHNFGSVTVPESQICSLDKRHFFVHHFISNNASTYMRSMDRYTDIQAPRLLQADPSRGNVGLLSASARSAKMFIVNYFVGGAYKAGAAGLLAVFQMVYYGWLLSMKCFEWQHGLTLDSIEALNDKSRQQIVVTPN